MLVKVKNPELYKDWIAYFERIHPNWPGYEQRTYAFFNSQKGESIPLS